MKFTGPHLLGYIPKRRPDAHKGSYGRVLVTAGSRGMSGAAYLSALAALKTGAGLVRILTPECNRAILQASLPEAIVVSYEESKIQAGEEEIMSRIEHSAKEADIVVLGPGLGQEMYVALLIERILSVSDKTTILDADALNVISRHPGLFRYFHSGMVVTPHIQEMARLTGKSKKEIMENRVSCAVSFRGEHSASCILKSDQTVIAAAGGNVFYHERQVPALSKAGSGDVLTGILAGVYAVGTDREFAAAAAVWIHGAAGAEAADIYGNHGVIARDIIGRIPSVMKKAENEDWKELK